MLVHLNKINYRKGVVKCSAENLVINNTFNFFNPVCVYSQAPIGFTQVYMKKLNIGIELK